MNKYLRLLRFELKGLTRDPITLLLLAFPALLLALSCYALPLVLRTLPPMEALAAQAVTLLMIMMVASFGGIMAGAMATFTLLDHKDEHTLHTIAATPLGLPGYLLFKMAYVYLSAAMSVFLVLFGTKLLAADAYTLMGIRLLDRLSAGDIIAFSLVSALTAPLLALLLGALSKNKVEGFAWIKGSGMLAFIPLLLLLPAFNGAKQYFLGIFPNFWASKGLTNLLLAQRHPADLSFALYLFIGAALSLLVTAGALRLFLSKVQY